MKVACSLLVWEILEIDRAVEEVEEDTERVVFLIASRHGRFWPYNMLMYFSPSSRVSERE